MAQTNKKRFSYKEWMSRLNEIVDPNSTQLPSSEGKNNVLEKIGNILKEYRAPVLYRYMPISLNAILSILNEDVYMVPAKCLNDVFEGAAYGRESSGLDSSEEISRIQSEIYVKAFSSQKNNNLMWSHYGDSHQGICIGYDFSKVPDEVLAHLYPVQYSNTRFSHDRMQTIEPSPFLYLRKSSCWRYEKEIRMIYKKDDLLNNTYSIELNCIKDIQFGVRTNPEYIKIIADLVKDKDIKLYRTTLKEDSFELERTYMENSCNNYKNITDVENLNVENWRF